MNDVVYRRKNCRACNCQELDLVLSLNPTPIGDAYVSLSDIDVVQPSFPIDLYMCQSCGLAQLLDVIDPKILYGDYIYLTESSVGLSKHFEEYASTVIGQCDLKAKSLVIDLGSNDGTLLRFFQARGMDVLGIEPAAHIARHANKIGTPTIDSFFSPDLAKEVVKKYGRAKIITANGVFVFESYYLADLINNMVFDFIYHEHLSSFSVKPIQKLFKKIGLELVRIERIPTKGGSLRYYVQRNFGPVMKDGSVEGLVAQEEQMGLYKKSTYLEFTNKINKLKKDTKEFLEKLQKEGKKIAAFGASITCTTLIYHFEIGSHLSYLVDDNVAKQGRFSPGLHLPVLAPSVLHDDMPDYVIILAWRFRELIISSNLNYLEKGGGFLTPIPSFEIINKNNIELRRSFD